MAKKIECGKGHFYDPDEYSTCPHCNNEINFVNGATPVFAGGSTAPIAGGFSPVNQTMGPSIVSDIGKTAPIGYEMKVTDHMETRPIAEKKFGYVPTVGWLVCIEGNDIGKDFRLKAKVNTVGRDTDNDVVLTGDDHISGLHIKIGYDARNVRYTLIVCGSNCVYLNGKSIYTEADLNPYDVIDFDVAKLMFVPLCTDSFNWTGRPAGGEGK